MGFLSTLAGNLPFLIVVLAGLFSLYKKFNASGGQQQRKPGQPGPLNRMPTFGGGPGEMKKPVRKAAPNPWEVDHELKRRQEELEREQEEWRREERAEAERKARREEEEAASGGAFAGSAAGQEKAAPKRSSPFQSTGTGRSTSSRPVPPSDPREIGSRDAAAHPAINWTPEGEELAKAVVWSEILGAPRSKRPYGSKLGQ